MIRLNQTIHQVRVDTTIKIIQKDGTEVSASVVVLIGLNHIEKNNQYNFYKIADGIFNKDFTLDRRPKIAPKKPWWKVW